jgi:Tol biopolymer transport system component
MSSLSTAFGQAPLGIFEASGDVGPVANAGSTTFDPVDERYTLTGSGANMWADHDECQFAYKKITGDFLIRARAKFVSQGGDPHRKIGVMIRSSLEPDVAYVDVAIHGDGLTSMQYRRDAGDETEQTIARSAAAEIVELQRKGDTCTMRVAWDGEPFSGPSEIELELPDEVLVGVFVCAHDANAIEEAQFDNVRIVVPAADDFVPYRDYIGSNLEIMNVETGVRRVVYRTADNIEAPNWTPDGRWLVFNSGGRLYRLDLRTRDVPEPTEIYTGAATSLNNDHVISPDGTMIAISSNDGADRQSLIYTLPIDGGEPTLVTPTGPSYLHGWSPDGSELVFTGGRDGNYDIYAIPARGGLERRLTTAEGLDDGPEFTPDGSRVYFNSNRTGRMQIWRMPSGGYEHEQVTDDRFNNWFPHISPDGRQIVFISFGGEVASDDHPYYKHVYLRMMPFPAGRPRVIAYVYGGQGTINVPSWSPDSKLIAFVSNTAGN